MNLKEVAITVASRHNRTRSVDVHLEAGAEYMTYQHSAAIRSIVLVSFQAVLPPSRAPIGQLKDDEQENKHSDSSEPQNIELIHGQYLLSDENGF